MATEPARTPMADHADEGLPGAADGAAARGQRSDPLGRPTFLSAVRACQQSIKLYIYLLGLIAVLPASILFVDKQLKIDHVWISIVLCALPALIMLMWLIPKWADERNKQKAIALGIGGHVKDAKYFRLVPYKTGANFDRADGAHITVYEWISKSKDILLYLSGASGSGKSSIVSGWVIPRILSGSSLLRVVQARIVGNPITAITEALLESNAIRSRRPPDSHDLRELLRRCINRLAPLKLLLVLDQFEEFLILCDENQRAAFTGLLKSLADSSLANLQILMILRSDYLGILDKLGLPPLVQHQNWEEVPAFTERDAMAFLRGSGLSVSPTLEQEIVDEAREIEETKGMIRPITINLFGLLISRFESLPKDYQPGTRLRSYLRDQINRREIREFAPHIVRSMITDNGTKMPVTLADLSKATGLEFYQVRGCLVQLGNEGVVRELDPKMGKWEISHDFIAKLYDRIVAGWRLSAWRRFRTVVLGVTLGVWVIAILTVPALVIGWERSRDFTTLGRFNFQVRNSDVGLEVSSMIEVDEEDLIDAVPLFRKLDVRHLYINSAHIRHVEPLKGLTALQVLDLSSTRVSDVEALEGLTALQTLNLSRTEVWNISALRSLTALKTLDLSSTRVSNVKPLEGLTALQTLDLSKTYVSDLEPLRGLTGLQTLNLSRTQVSDMEPLRGLTAMQTLDLSWTEASNVEPLEGLTALQTLDLRFTAVSDVETLKLRALPKAAILVMPMLSPIGTLEIAPAQ
jgi:hypothetical protein